MSSKKTFRVPLPKTALEFTGERFTTIAQGEIRHEHLHRYFFALQFCTRGRVLDIACGEGYGSALLAGVAREVIGVDADAEAIRHAAENYSTESLTFLCGDARRMPVATGSIDIVISFETLEHLGEQEEFLREIKRVLHPGGLLVMSTPDHEFFAASPPNPFHVKELGRTGFEGLIGEHFRNSSFFLQSSVMGSLIVPDRASGNYEGFRHVNNNLYESARGLPAAMYMVGVASDAPLPEVLAGSFDDREFQLGLYAELQRRHIEMLRRAADVEALRAEGEEQRKLREESLRSEHAAGARALKAETELGLRQEEKNRWELDRAALEGALREREANALQLSGELLVVRSSVTKLTEDRQVLHSEAERLRERILEVESSLRRSGELLQSLQDKTENEIGVFKGLESQAREEVRQLRDDRARREAEFAAAAAHLAAQRDDDRQKAAGLREEVDAVKGSLSWKASAPLRWMGMPAVKILAAARKAMYGTPAFAYTGKPLARLLSGVSVPGARWLLPQNPLFDAAFYKRRYPDAAQGSKNLWAHYLAYGSDESRDPHPLFQSAYYQARNPDVSASGINPLIHYFDHGAREGRNPSPDFDTSFYLEQYPDVRASGVNPLVHFAMHGKAEGRRTSRAETPKAVQPIPILPRTPDPAAQGPFISVLMPTFNTPARYLLLAIESVLSQTFQGWELCIYDDGSSLTETLDALRQYQGREPRIRVAFGGQNRGIAAATNEAMALATGQYIAMLDHDDVIAPEALLEISNVLHGNQGIDALYTDQAYIEADGRVAEPFYKPDWSPELFRGVMFVGHLLVVRRSLAIELNGFDATFDRVQDFEFMLRVSEKGGKIYHLPKILYFWRRIPGSVAFHGDEKGPIEPIQASAVNAHLARMRIPAIAEPHPALAHRLTIKPAPRASAPSVSIVVREAPGRDSAACISSILERSTYSNFKVLTALDGSSEYLIWIDPNLEVTTPDWIERLLLYCGQPAIACAAPLLVNLDGTVWHSGLVLRMNGMVGYPMQGWPSESDGYAGSLSCAREVSCLSGECLMISREKLEAMGGLAGFYQDSLYEGADLSLRACTAGLRNIVDPRVVLRKIAGPGAADRSRLDRALFADRWSGVAKYGDRFYNPNFIGTSPGYQPKASITAAAS